MLLLSFILRQSLVIERPCGRNLGVLRDTTLTSSAHCRSAFVTSSTKRDYSGWTFISCSSGDFGLTWLTQGKSHRQRRESAFSARVVKYWNKFRLPSLLLLLSIFSRKGWLKSYLPNTLHPLTVIISICNPTSCSVYVVSSGLLWPTFYHYKS